MRRVKNILFFFTGIILLLNFISAKTYAAITATLSSTNPAVAAANVCAGSTKVPIYRFVLTISGSNPTSNFTGFTFTTNAGYVAADVTKFQLWRNTVDNLSTATQLSTDIVATLGPGAHPFAAFSQTLTLGSTFYYWVTTDVAIGATNNNLLTVAAITTANITTSGGSKAGSASIGGTQTPKAPPTTVTVSGGGTFCGGSTTLTASGGVGGTMYWQNTTSGGTSTATPSSSQVVSSSGTYYFRAQNATGCWSVQGSATVTFNAVPTITLGSNPLVCTGITSANLTYSATTGSPNQYSINYDATAEGQGFVDVNNAALPASPIVLTVPGAAAANTYNYTVTVRNSGTGCVSSGYAKTIIVSGGPATPGAISGPATLAPNNVEYIYSIASVPAATNYIWTLPAGAWGITAGSGAISITVTAGNAGQNGNITVRASNACGTSAASSKAVTVAATLPHNNCSQCHILHGAPGIQITDTIGNPNLCISCHNSVGAASLKPFTNAMKAVPGTSGTSHNWDKPSVNATFETNKATNAELLKRLPGDSIICSTCHNQHSETNRPFLRISNAGDALCKDCHTARNKARYQDNPANKGTHPVGITYPADTRFYGSPTNTNILLKSGNVECSSCHKMHHNTDNNGYILRAANDDNLCKSCHTYGDHNGMSCTRCHQTHNTNKTNILMIRNTISTPNSGNKTVAFTSQSGAKSHADGDATYDGVCEVCHTATPGNKHLNTGAGDHAHNAGTNCATCHTHKSNFAGCTACHASNFPEYSTDAHSKHTNLYGGGRYPCSTCHYQRGAGTSYHENATKDVNFDPNGLARRNGLDSNTPSYNSGTKVCTNVYCHSNGVSADRSTDGTYTWGNASTDPVVYAATPSWATGTIATCTPCHAGKGNMNSPYTITIGDGNNATSADRPTSGEHERGAHATSADYITCAPTNWPAPQCFWCHDVSPTVTPNCGTNYQGTYGTSFHVDGQTYFKPLRVSAGGTMSDNMTRSNTDGHCSASQKCWW